MTTLGHFRNYLVFRRNGLRNAWRIAGMTEVAIKVGTYLVGVLLLATVYLAASQYAQATSEAADNRVAAKVAQQAGYIKALEKALAACLGDRDGVLAIGGELYFCKAISIGEKVK